MSASLDLMFFSIKQATATRTHTPTHADTYTYTCRHLHLHLHMQTPTLTHADTYTYNYTRSHLYTYEHWTMLCCTPWTKLSTRLLNHQYCYNVLTRLNNNDKLVLSILFSPFPIAIIANNRCCSSLMLNNIICCITIYE